MTWDRVRICLTFKRMSRSGFFNDLFIRVLTGTVLARDLENMFKKYYSWKMCFPFPFLAKLLSVERVWEANVMGSCKHLTQEKARTPTTGQAPLLETAVGSSPLPLSLNGKDSLSSLPDKVISYNQVGCCEFPVCSRAPTLTIEDSQRGSWSQQTMLSS